MYLHSSASHASRDAFVVAEDVSAAEAVRSQVTAEREEGERRG